MLFFFIKVSLIHKMNLSKASIFMFCFLLQLNINASGNKELGPVINTVKAMVKYFSVTCVYFLTTSTTDTSNQRLANLVFSELNAPLAFSNFSAYRNKLEKEEREQCQVPLRVGLHLYETTLSKEFKDLNKLYSNYYFKIRSGAWLVFTKSFEDKFVAEFFRNVYIPMDMEVLVAWIHNDTVHLKEVYQVSPSHSLRQHYFGKWSPKTGFITPKIFSIYSRRTDLEGLELKVGYIDENLPFTVAHPNAGSNIPTGYFGEIWQILEGFMNISSIYVKVDLNREKGEDENSWLRVMKMLKEGKIDAGLGDFVVSTARVDFLDFSYPLLQSNFQVFYKNYPLSQLSQGYLLPFGKDTWLSLLTWSVINSFCISCFTRIRKHFTRKGKIIRIQTSYFTTVGVLCGQGSPNTPNFPSCRLLFLFTFIVATIVIPSYSASLTRYLTSKSLGVILKDLNDISKTGSHKILVVDGSYEYYYFNLSKDSDSVRKIYEQHMKNVKLPASYREALLLTCNEKNTAFFTITSTLNWELNKAENGKLRENCGLGKLAQDAGTLLNGIVYPKNSRFRGLIDHHLKNLQKIGAIDRLQQKYWTNYRNLRKKSWEAVGFQNSSAVFDIILCGTILSFLIVLLEQIINQRIQKKCRKKRLRLFALS